MVLAAPDGSSCQAGAPLTTLRGGCTPAFPFPNLITACFFTNYNAQIRAELKATVRREPGGCLLFAKMGPLSFPFLLMEIINTLCQTTSQQFSQCEND